MPATMARNWKTTPLTLALLATFSGSMTISFLPVERTRAIGDEGGQRRAAEYPYTSGVKVEDVMKKAHRALEGERLS